MTAHAALLLGAGVAAVASSRRGPTASVRAATVTTSAVLAQLEHDLPGVLDRGAGAGHTAWVAATAYACARRVRDAWAGAPSGRRGALLHRQTIELELVLALLQGRPPTSDVLPRLERLSDVFEHVADVDGPADTAGTRALAHVAASDRAAAVAALGDADRLGGGARGVANLARRLLEDSGAAEPRPASASQQVL